MGRFQHLTLITSSKAGCLVVVNFDQKYFWRLVLLRFWRVLAAVDAFAPCRLELCEAVSSTSSSFLLPKHNIQRLRRSFTSFLDITYSQSHHNSRTTAIMSRRYDSRVSCSQLRALNLVDSVCRRPSSLQKDVSIKSSTLLKPSLMQVPH